MRHEVDANLAAAVKPAASRAVAGATLAFGVSFAVWGSIAALAPIFRARLGLTQTEVGLLIAVPVLVGSLARLGFGLAADRAGPRRVLLALLAALVGAVALASAADGYGALLAAGALVGIAGATFAVGAPIVVRSVAAERRGLALGVYGIGNAGTAVAVLVLPRIAAATGPERALLAFVPLLLATIVIVLVTVPRDTPSAAAAGGWRVFLGRPDAWVLALFYVVTFGGFVATSSYLPTLLVTLYGLDPADAGARAAGFVLFATVARLAGGALADRFGGSVVLNGSFIAVAILAISLAFEPSLEVITVPFLAIALALGVGNGAVFQVVGTRFAQNAGAVTGLVGTAGGLGGFFPPLLLGAVRDLTGSYAIAFMLLSELALACLIVNVLALQQRAAAFAAAERR